MMLTTTSTIIIMRSIAMMRKAIANNSATVKKIPNIASYESIITRVFPGIKSNHFCKLNYHFNFISDSYS